MISTPSPNILKDTPFSLKRGIFLVLMPVDSRTPIGLSEGLSKTGFFLIL